jgi:2-oxoglutarate ferredoxin oxidoreductase subunit gamma
VVKTAGIVLINSSLISIDAGREDVDVIKVPVTSIAKDLGSVRAANIVALGAFVARPKLLVLIHSGIVFMKNLSIRTTFYP